LSYTLRYGRMALPAAMEWNWRHLSQIERQPSRWACLTLLKLSLDLYLIMKSDPEFSSWKSNTHSRSADGAH
jgi:hypothetical protein